jgi:hypothetical protein
MFHDGVDAAVKEVKMVIFGRRKRPASNEISKRLWKMKEGRHVVSAGPMLSSTIQLYDDTILQ